MPVTFLDLTLPDLHQNLALDEALLLEAEAGTGGEVLRLWEWKEPAVVLGAAGKIADDVDEEECKKLNIPIARRSTGGGTVVLGAGCLEYSLILKMERNVALRSIVPSYQWILKPLAEALKKHVPAVGVSDSGDLIVGDRKVGGCAQQRKRQYLLHHGTILYDFDLMTIYHALHEPHQQPDYRQRRPHDLFVTNLKVPADVVRSTLEQIWHAHGRPIVKEGTINRLVADQYSRPEWIRRL